MLQPKKRPKFLYSEEAMEAAVKAVREGLSPYSASKRYGVPRSTLENKISGKSQMGRKMGPSSTLGDDIEIMLTNWVKAMANRGFPIKAVDLVTSVKQIVKDMNLEHNFKDGTPGRKWMTLFLKRHPDIAKREAEKLTKSRAHVTEESIRSWFKEVSEYCKSEKLDEALSDHSRVFNTDETGFVLCPNTGKVLAAKGQKNVYDVHSGSGKESITVLTTVNASGKCAPTLVVFPGKRLPSAIKTSMPPGPDWCIGHSDNGWMTSEVFFEYMMNSFFHWVVSEKIKLPVILFLDGHKSHLTYNLSKFCAEKKIVLVALYPNATHILQPLDVALFRPLKQNWAKCVHEFRMNPNTEGETLTKYNFAIVLKKAFDATFVGKTVENGFKVCGLYPFDSNNVDYTKCDVLAIKHVGSGEENQNDKMEEPEETHQRGAGCLKHLETFINPETLEEFKKTYQLFTPIWVGDNGAHDLYVTWKKMKDQVTKNCAKNEGNHQVCAVTQEDIELISRRKVTAQEEQTLSDNLISPHLQDSSDPDEPMAMPLPSISDLDELTSTPIASGSMVKPQASGSREEELGKRQKLAQVLSPKTAGSNVPSPLKSHLYWPDSPKKKANSIRKKIKMPSVLTSEVWMEIELRKKKEKEQKEKEKEERKKKREVKKVMSSEKGKKQKTKQIQDVEEEWICKICQVRYSAEIIKKLRRRWVECDECHGAFHYKCIPRSHLDTYGLEDDDEDEDEVTFICHLCVKDNSDDDFNFLESSDDEAS